MSEHKFYYNTTHDCLMAQHVESVQLFTHRGLDAQCARLSKQPLNCHYLFLTSRH